MQEATQQLIKDKQKLIQELIQIAEERGRQIENLFKIADDNLELAQSWKTLHLDTQSFLRKEVLLELRTAVRAHILCFVLIVGFLLTCLYLHLWLGAVPQALLLLVTIKDILDNRRRAAKMQHLLDNPLEKQT